MIAVIAGTGCLPIHACQAFITQQKQFFVISLFPEDNLTALQEAIGNKAEIIAKKYYKAGAILDLLKKKQTHKVLFIGKVDKRHLLSHVKLDWFAVKLLSSLFYKNDSAIMTRLLEELAQHNIEVLNQSDILSSLLVKPGVLCGTLTEDMASNIKMGIQTAMALSEIDIGQTVVIKDKMVLAVEAIEGTDACIKRGIELGKKDVIICKAARTHQNKKFDLPTLGPQTLSSFQPGHVAAISWLASHTFIADQEKFIAKAKELGITLVAYAPPTDIGS